MKKTKDEILMVALGVKQFTNLEKWQKEQLYYAMDEWATTNQPNGSNMVLAPSGPTDDEILTAAHNTVKQYMKEDTPMMTYVNMKEAFKDAVKWLKDYQAACAKTKRG
jgi:carbamoylphosphate synthase small subunit